MLLKERQNVVFSKCHHVFKITYQYWGAVVAHSRAVGLMGSSGGSRVAVVAHGQQWWLIGEQWWLIKEQW
jgi:hypothetical protein